MNIGKIAGIGISSALVAGALTNKLRTSIYDIGVTNIDACNENNRAWLCDEPANFDRFEKKYEKSRNAVFMYAGYISFIRMRNQFRCYNS